MKAFGVTIRADDDDYEGEDISYFEYYKSEEDARKLIAKSHPDREVMFMELSENQEQFCKDAEEDGLEMYFTYSGRYMYGKECPAVIVSGLGDFSTKANYSSDNMGLDYVVYAPR